MKEKIEVKNDAGILVAKVYFSPDQKKLRVVLPSLSSFAQAKVDIDNHLVDVTLDARQATAELDAHRANYFKGMKGKK